MIVVLLLTLICIMWFDPHLERNQDGDMFVFHYTIDRSKRTYFKLF
jgi:hypothetical protein